jgi:CRISPR/Cas system-associated exonuclease Cas4 (RecB family)
MWWRKTLVLNSDVNKAAYFAYRKAQIVAMGTERLGVIHVSDLIKPCMRNIMYGKFIPHEYRSMTTEDMKAMFYGQAVHKVTNLSTNPEDNETFFAYDYEKDESLTYEQSIKIKSDDPRQLDIIYGSADDILEVDGELVIIDKKTTGSIDYFSRATSKASESHITQINCYAVLLDKCYGRKAKRGCNIYISNSISKEKRDIPTPITYKLGKPEEYLNMMITNARSIKESLKSKELPERTRCFLCDGMCPYINQCFGENDDKNSK